MTRHRHRSGTMYGATLHLAGIGIGTLALLTMLWHGFAPVLAGAAIAAVYYGDTTAGIALGLVAGLGQFAAPALATRLATLMDNTTDRARRAAVR